MGRGGEIWAWLLALGVVVGWAWLLAMGVVAEWAWLGVMGWAWLLATAGTRAT